MLKFERLVFLGFLGLVACGGAEEKSPVDSGQPSSLSPPCDVAARVNYTNFGQGFLIENCQGCHASSTANRYGAPEGVSFDDVDQVWQHADRILERSVYSESNMMPPAGGPDADALTRLEWWLLCAEEGT
jgi:uncharacterized membrane protein